METIKELRQICQIPSKKQGLAARLDGFAGLFSIYFTKALMGRGISDKTAGALTMFTGLAACFVLLGGSFLTFLLGSLLLEVWYLLGLAAIEMRRYRVHKENSAGQPLTGIYFDTINAYTISLLAPFAVAFGFFASGGGSFWLIPGVLASALQVLLMVMHHAQESALLRKINHEAASFQIRQPESESGSAAGASALTKLLDLSQAVVTFPGLAHLLVIFAGLQLLLNTASLRPLALVIMFFGAFGPVFITAARKIKNNDPDKQFEKLFQNR